MEYPARRPAHDSNIYNNIFASDHPALYIILIVVYIGSGEVNIVIMSLVLCVEIVRCGDIIHN